MTAKSSQSSLFARGSVRSNLMAGFMAVTTVCAIFCAGCQENSATGYHEYSGNGKSQESLLPKEDATSDKGKSPHVADATAQQQPFRPSEPLVGPISADKLAQPSNSNAAGTAAASVDTASAPVVAPKPVAVAAAAQNPIGAAQATIATPSQPLKPKVLVTERKFQTAGPDDAVRMTYDDIDLLKVLNMDPVTPDALKMMPDWLKGLEGKRVRLRGFMFPANSQFNLAGFSLARDNQICCFVRKPKAYDVFPVKLRDGVTTDYIAGRPIDVVGIFHFLPEPEYWPIDGMYFIEDAIVIDKR